MTVSLLSSPSPQETVFDSYSYQSIKNKTYLFRKLHSHYPWGNIRGNYPIFIPGGSQRLSEPDLGLPAGRDMARVCLETGPSRLFNRPAHYH